MKSTFVVCEPQPPEHWQAAIEFPATTAAPQAARRATAALLAAWDLADLRDDAALIVTELMTNALRHAPGTGHLEIVLVGDRHGVRICVPDNSPAIPVIGALAPARSDGRGMRLVANLASEWGTEPRSGGKLVWARLQRAS